MTVSPPTYIGFEKSLSNQQLSEGMNSSPDKVLIVTEDASLRFNLRKTLEMYEFDWGEASNGDIALTRLQMVDYEAVLLDLPMTGVDGLELCRKVRRVYPRLPLMVLSDYDSLDNKVEAFEAGADDYVVKPVPVREFIARLRSAIRRFHAPAVGETERFVVGDIMLDPSRRRVEKAGVEVALTPIEFRTLQMLMEQASKPVPYAAIVTALWGQESMLHRERLRVVIGALRKKLEADPSQPMYLITHNLFGYSMRER
jgi:two-component system, OmpR family, KDP operon response regulator KdpE